MKVSYVKGKLNIRADAFTRMDYNGGGKDECKYHEVVRMDSADCVIDGNYIEEGQDED